MAEQSIGQWLGALGLERYTALFEEQEVDLRDLPHLSDEDLKELGLPLGPRRRLLAAAATILGDDEPAASDPAVSSPPGPTPDTPAPRAERRQVTVLFCDLSGFTRISADRDPEDVHRLLNRFFAVADSVVENFGGRVDKHIGDAVMAVFGAPVAHGDDPERAVRAALEMQAAAAEIESGLQVHAGIASGEVLASTTGSDHHREYTVTGDSVNLAARLTDLAPADGIIVSDDVQAALGDGLEAQDMGPTAVDGLAQPIRLWRVSRLADGRGRRGPLIGRDAERRLFEELLKSCRAEGRGHSVLLRGEPGIGKSHLADHLEGLAREAGYTVAAAQVLDFGATRGRGAVTSLLADLCPDAQTPADWAVSLLGDVALQERDGAVLADLLPQEPDAGQRALLQAMDDATREAERDRLLGLLLAARAAETPVLLRVEDIHWADDGTLRQLARLAEITADVPLFCLFSSRIEGDPITPGWRAETGGARITTLDLVALSAEEAAALAAQSGGVSPAVRQACIERADGNPLFLQQLLRNADESAREGLPGTLQSILLSRLDRLGPTDREVMDAAAVLGQRFEAEALCAVAGIDGFDAAGLQAAGLIHSLGRDWSFAHALIRDAAYAALVGDQRRHLHRAAAAWFAATDPVLHARHLERAEDPAAPAALVAAGHHEARGFRYAPALDLADAAVARAGPGNRFAALALRAEMLEALGRMADALEAWSAAGEEAADAAEECEALIGRAAVLRLLGQGESARPDLARAEALAVSAGLVQARSRIAGLLGSAAFATGDMTQCLDDQRRSLALAREADDRRLETMALGNLSDAEYARGRMATALERMQACVDLAHEQGFLRIRTVNCFMLGNLRRYVSGIAPAETVLREAWQLSDQVMLLRPRINARNILGEVLLDRGAYGEARDCFEAALELVEQLDNDRYRLYLRYERARALAGQDRPAEALQDVETALVLSQRTGMRFHGPRLLALRALIRSDRADSVEDLDRGEAVIGEGVNAHNVLWFRRDAIEWALRRADWDCARRQAEALAAFVAEEPFPWASFFAARGIALADAGTGRGNEEALRDCLERGRAHGLAASLPALEAALSA